LGLPAGFPCLLFEIRQNESLVVSAQFGDIVYAHFLAFYLDQAPISQIVQDAGKRFRGDVEIGRDHVLVGRQIDLNILTFLNLFEVL
jgi:hypothetical protein